MTNEQEAELMLKVKELEMENYELAEIKGKYMVHLMTLSFIHTACIVQYEKVKEKLEITENQIEELRQRLDDALGAEELVEQLTEKNLLLTEQLEEINSSNEELEALKELADELEENHVETEKQLQAEIGKIGHYITSFVPF